MASATQVVLAGPAGATIRGGYFGPSALSGSLAAADAVASGGLSSSAPPPPPPPPPPAPSTGNPQPFQLISPTIGPVVFALGYEMVQGHVPAGQSLLFSGATAKLVILSTWPDGSARMGIIAGTYTSAGSPVTVTPTVGVVADGTLMTAADVQTAMGANTAVFGCGGFGTVTFGTSDFASPFHVHARTSDFIEAIYRKPVGSDQHLVAWMQLRVWRSGPVESLPWIENGYLNVAGPTNKSANFTFTLAGSERFNGAINLLNHQRTPLVSGAVLGHWLSSDPDVTPIHDKAYLQATRLVPAYRATVGPTSAPVTSRPSTFSPLQQGDYPTGMGSAGYHPSIGLLPEWDVIYLCTTAASMHAVVERNAYSAGRYGIHFRDETTNRPLRFSQYPNLVIGGGSGVGGSGASSTNTYTPNATGGDPPTYNSTHHPSMGFMAYLLTGRFYHLETAQFVATVNYLKNGNLGRNGSDGVFLSTAGANTTRGVGWALRSLAQVAAVTPDSDPLAAEFRASLIANINWYHTRYVAQPNNPQGFIQPYTDYTAPVVATVQSGSTSTDIVLPSGYVFTSDGYYVGWELVVNGQAKIITAYVGATRTATVATAYTGTVVGAQFELRTDNLLMEATWMQDFVTAALGYAKALQPPMSSTERTRLDQLFEWKAKSIVGRLGTAGPIDFLFRDAAQYTIAVAPSNFPDWAGGTGPWFNNWGEAWTATLNGSGLTKTLGDGSLRGGNIPDPTSYWGNLQPAIAYAVEHGAWEAVEAYLRMVNSPTWATLAAGFDSAPVWGIKPPVDPAVLPSYVPASGSVANIHANTLAEFNPCPTNNCWYSQASKQEAAWRNWNGAAFLRSYSVRGALAFWGGGHGGGEDVSIYVFDFTTCKWSRLGPDNPATSDYTNNLDTTFYDYMHQGSYIVPALHTYSYVIEMPPNVPGVGPKGAWALLQLVGGPNSGSAPHAADCVTGQWTRLSSNKPGFDQSPYASAFTDTRRLKAYWAGLDASNVNSMPLGGTSVPRIVTRASVPNGGSMNFGFYYSRMLYVPEADQVINIGCWYGQTNLRAEVFNMATGQPVPVGGHTFGTTLNLPVGAHGAGVDWCEPAQAFYLYPGWGSTLVYKLKPSDPSNLYTSTWTITTEPFANPAWNTISGAGAQGAQPFSRWRYIPALRSFAWCDGPVPVGVSAVDGVSRSGVMQLWRPVGV